jgi:serine phosphatase RsbU (regulator of sigma subunit)/pSer/pThr/pTyr-binding forkhead associated (FHA) protein
MSVLFIMRGPEAGRSFPLQNGRTTLGRNADCNIQLTGKQVSRHHAHVFLKEDQYYLQDLGSSNGTFVNNERLPANVPQAITERDAIQIGPYLFGLRAVELPPTEMGNSSSVVIRETINATSWDDKLIVQDPAAKLQVVLDISKQLACTLELDPLLDKLLEQLMKLFPNADRLMVILCEGDKLILRAQRTRPGHESSARAFSNTIIRRALDEGIGLISEDVQSDEAYQSSQSIASLDLHSTVCVPLITLEGRRLGVIQVDRFGKGFGFRTDDLQLLTAIGMETTVVLENVTLHAEVLREQRLKQELALAQDIQQNYLPEELEGFPDATFEVYGRVYPARQVAGDFYDFVRTASGLLAFFIGDVSGKGMPAALFMVAVRTLCRHMTREVDHPAQLLDKLNVELADDNPNCMFVTLAHGIFDPQTGQVLMASAGHPPPLVRRADGEVHPLAIKPGRLLGYNHDVLQFQEAGVTLGPGDALFFFTDGFFEPRASKRMDMFGMERIESLVRACEPHRPLPEFMEAARRALELFTGSKELQDDLTLLILRRKPN